VVKTVALQIVGVALIILGILLVPSAAVVVMIMPETFASTARIVPGATDPVLVAREIEKIKSPPLLTTVITNLDLNKKWGQKMSIDELPIDLTVSMVLHQLEVRQESEARIIWVTVSSEDKNEAAVIANDIAKVYMNLSRGADGKAQAHIIESAQPSLRPVRKHQKRGVAATLAMAILFVGVGLYLIRLSRKEALSALRTQPPPHSPGAASPGA
jgi:capsular polysaccharide biosynthesis protein